MKTGIIVFDSEGNYYLETFEGHWFIPELTIEEARDAIWQMPGFEKIQYEGLAGKLARGVVVGDVVRNISYRISGKEWPDRSAYGPQGGVA